MKRKLILMAILIAFPCVTLQALVFQESFDDYTIDQFFSIDFGHSSGSKIGIAEDPDLTTRNTCLKIEPSLGVYLTHQFDELMKGTVSFRYFDNMLLPFFGGMRINEACGYGETWMGVWKEATQIYYGAGIRGYGCTPDWCMSTLGNIPITAPCNQERWAAEHPHYGGFYDFNWRTYGWHTFEGVFDTDITKFIVDGNMVYWAPAGIGIQSLSLCFENYDDYPCKTFYMDDFDCKLTAMTPVPEPGSLMMLGTALIGLAGFIIKKGERVRLQ